MSKSSIKRLIGTGVLRGLNALTSLAAVLFLSRHFGAEGYGSIAALLAAGFLLNGLLFQWLSTYLQISFYSEENKSQLLSAVLILYVVFAAMAFLAAVLLQTWGPPLLKYAIFAVVIAFFTALSDSVLSIAIACYNKNYLAVCLIAKSLAVLIALFAILTLSLQWELAALVLAMVSIAPFGLVLFLLRRDLSFRFSVPSRAYFAKVMGPSLKIAPGQISACVAATSDKILIASSGGAFVVGVYAAVYDVIFQLCSAFYAIVYQSKGGELYASAHGAPHDFRSTSRGYALFMGMAAALTVLLSGAVLIAKDLLWLPPISGYVIPLGSIAVLSAMLACAKCYFVDILLYARGFNLAASFGSQAMAVAMVLGCVLTLAGSPAMYAAIVASANGVGLLVATLLLLRFSRLRE